MNAEFWIEVLILVARILAAGSYLRYRHFGESRDFDSPTARLARAPRVKKRLTYC